MKFCYGGGIIGIGFQVFCGNFFVCIDFYFKVYILFDCVKMVVFYLGCNWVGFIYDVLDIQCVFG